jgi:hypothetical protein
VVMNFSCSSLSGVDEIEGKISEAGGEALLSLWIPVHLILNLHSVRVTCWLCPFAKTRL